MKRSLVVILAVLIATLATSVMADDTPSCAQKLIPCSDYLHNITNPPSSCCTPLKDAVANDRVCLCNLYNTPGFLESLGVNISQAIQLTQACGSNVGSDMCKVSAPPPTTGSSSPVPGSDNDSAAGRIAWTGISTLLLCWVSMMLF